MANTFTLAGTFKDAKNNPLYVGEYVIFRITSVGTDVEDAVAYPQDSVDMLIDENGDFGGDLWINGDSGVDCLYEILEPSGQRLQVIIPSSDEGATVRYEYIVENYQTESSSQQSTVLGDAKAYTDQEIDAFAADPSSVAALAPAEWRTDLGLEIGVDVQPYDATILVDADIGSTVQAWDSVLDATTASFLVADELKLDGIEPLADVTDATNVEAAGAIMDSDVGDIAVPSAQVVKSYRMGSTSDELSIPDDPTVDMGFDDYSFVFWVKMPVGAASADKYIIAKATGGTGYSAYVDPSGSLYSYLGGSFFTSTPSLPLQDDRWHCIAMTFDRDGDLDVYVDGTLHGSDDISAKFSTNLDNTADLSFASLSGSSAMNEGYLGNYIAITKDLLTAAEIQTLAVNPHYVLELDNLAACLEVPAQGSFFDRSPNAATVTLTGTLEYLGYSDFFSDGDTQDYIQLDTAAPAPVYTAGRLYFDDTEKVMKYDVGVDDVTNSIGEELYAPSALNNTGVTITNGQIVRLNSSGTIQLAQADTRPNSDGTLGVATHDIEHGTSGKVTTYGLVNDVDTSSYTVGSSLYLSSTVAGDTTDVIPNLPILLGTVWSSHATTGQIFVNIEDLRVASNIPFFKDFTSTTQGLGSGTFYAGGFYEAPAASTTVNQGSTTQTDGTAGHSHPAHAFIVMSGAGTASGGSGSVAITVSGTSITDTGVRTTSDSETVLADITSASINDYYETDKKWLGQVTYTIDPLATGHTSYQAIFNYGFAKYDDLGNRSFTLTDFEVTGLGGATEPTGNFILLKHDDIGWTYHATAFDPGGTVICQMSTDHSTDDGWTSGDYFAYKRSGLSVSVDGESLEGFVVKFSTTVNNSVEYANIHVGSTL